ncbi:MAG: ROK family transcriptional regulator [Bacteroidota bacterium]|nr:ROK family transcriptional regulator [Bacteroidota bacterium]
MEFLQWYNKYAEDLSGVERKKFVQELKIIKYLYSSGPKSNSEICRHLKISAPSSFSILNELTTIGLIEKQGRGESIGGRKPDLYGVKNDTFYVLAIEMGKYKTQMAIFNGENANVTEVCSYSFLLDNSMDTIDKLYNYATELIAASGIDPLKVIAVGVSMPGLVDSRKGANYTYFNFKEKPVRKILQEKFKRPVFIENDAKAVALAEYRFGLAKGKKDVLSVFWDWGIGLGLILDGKLYRGTLGFAGELSHIPMVENGILCQCGKQGCLETIASAIALSRLALEGIKAGKTSIAHNLPDEDNDKVETRLVLEAANKGDQYAINILGEVGFNLGKGLSILIQLFNPELIIIGGRMAQAGEYITMPIQQSLNTYCMRQLKEPSSVVISEMGQRVGIMGAVAVILENIFDYYIKTSSK